MGIDLLHAKDVFWVTYKIQELWAWVSSSIQNLHQNLSRYFAWKVEENIGFDLKCFKVKYLRNYLLLCVDFKMIKSLKNPS